MTNMVVNAVEIREKERDPESFTFISHRKTKNVKTFGLVNFRLEISV